MNTRRPEWLDNVVLGSVRGLFELATRGLHLGVYVGAAHLVGASSLDPRAASTWLLAFWGYDFLYYWAHRASHRSGLLWATHEVHHQSTEMNITVGLRAAITNSFALLPFFLPLAMLGVPVSVYLGVSLAHLLAMTWLHTERIGPLPRLEGWLNTPALHALHHSQSPAHVDKNFGGVLIIYDRLFGTYAPAEEVEAYGALGRREAPGPLAAHLLPYADLVAAWRRAPSWRERLRVLV